MIGDPTNKFDQRQLAVPHTHGVFLLDVIEYENLDMSMWNS